MTAKTKTKQLTTIGTLAHDLGAFYQMVITVALGIATYILLTQDGKTYKVTGILVGLECSSRLYAAHVK